MREIRTYLAFTFPVDPVKMDTIPEMDMSYALASTLVEWDDHKQVRSAVVESWRTKDDRTFLFSVRKNLSWSDGNPVTSEQIKRSFERAFKTHPEDLRSLSNLLESIETPNSHELVFKLKTPVQQSDLLKKLTEPNFGVLNVRANGTLDLSVTTGAFFLKTGSNQELVLESNPHWHRFQPGVPNRVIVRRPPPKLNIQTALLNDSWPNLMETSSLIDADALSKYKTKGYSIWQRPIDKVFLFFLSRKHADADHFGLLKFLRAKLDRKKLTSGLIGFTLAEQIFPTGYGLYDPKAPSDGDSAELPKVFKTRSIEIMIAQGRITPTMKENLRQSLLSATGIEPKFTVIQLQDMGKEKRAGNFDIYAGTMGLADPDPEGIMSYYFEGETPVVPSSQQDDFVARLDQARKASNPQARLQLMREIATDAVRKGHVLPLFHLSTIGLGRSELDFSQVPTSEESVTFSKVRFRDTQNVGKTKDTQ